MEVYILRIATDPTLNLVALQFFVPRDSEVASSITTDCDHPNKYDLNQRNASPVTPMQFLVLAF